MCNVLKHQPGHAITNAHSRIRVSLPTQSAPPNSGTGLSQDLVRTLSPPPHEVEQSENWDQSLQSPSTVSLKIIIK